VERNQHFVDSKSGEEYLKAERTHEIQTHKLMTIVDHERNEYRRSGPEAFVDSKIGEKE